MIQKKRCSKCKKVLPVGFFSKVSKKRSKDGLYSQCRKCKRGGGKYCVICGKELSYTKTNSKYCDAVFKEDGSYDKNSCAYKGRMDKTRDRMKKHVPKEKARKAGKRWRDRNKFKAEYIFKSYKANAKITGKVFELTLSDIERFINMPCFYCGGKARGLDRKNNKIGYVKENIVSCCTTCNFAKGYRLTEKEFILLAQKIAKKHKKN